MVLIRAIADATGRSQQAIKAQLGEVGDLGSIALVRCCVDCRLHPLFMYPALFMSHSLSVIPLLLTRHRALELAQYAGHVVQTAATDG